MNSKIIPKTCTPNSNRGSPPEDSQDYLAIHVGIISCIVPI